MSVPSIPPEDQSQVGQFDPLVLDRSVIAMPLLKEMQRDLQLIAEALQSHPGLDPRRYNAAIRFNPDFPGGAAAARRKVLDMASSAADKAADASLRRLAQAGAQSGELAGKRHEALREAIAGQAIGELQPGGGYSFAMLHASIVRRLLAENEGLASAGDRGAQPIAGIYPQRFEVIIDLNLEHPGGREAARQWVLEHIDNAKTRAGVNDAGQEVHFEKDLRNGQYVFARLEARVIQALVEMDVAEAKTKAVGQRPAGGMSPGSSDAGNLRAIFHIWPDFEISACIYKSIATVKADAAHNSFSAQGAGITWAVMDSGIEAGHPHFARHKNLEVPAGWHRDFTIDGSGPFDDQNGHGTHVAGIIAGEWCVAAAAGPEIKRPLAVSRYLKTNAEDIEYQETQLERVSGMAPRCRLVSLRVLDEDGKGAVSNLIAAIDHVQEINGYGRRLLIQGVNMSVGYNFEPEWFACGQSPLCVEVDRLVKSGVVVVVAAGNTGYGTLKSAMGASAAGMALTINDPGNADLAITVGSTHRDMPHVYGVSYFSSKGPTGDGRLKPDLVAPGEKITSCATGNLKREGAKGRECDYVETSGTSMAAPHVSGVIAAFLSVRVEFVGKAERVKQIFVSTATDLKRDPYFQGAGVVDLMRAIQSV
jgi:serine protease AprX